MRKLVVLTALVFGLAGVYLWAAGRERPAVALDPRPLPTETPRWPGTGEPVVLVENYLCSHCRTFEKNTFARLQATGRPILIVNTVGRFPGDESVTRTALCVWRTQPEAYWDLRKAAYVGSGRNFVTAAARYGLNRDALERCRDSETVTQEVRRIDQYATRLGLRATPTLLIDGSAYVGPSRRQLQRLLN